MKHINNLILIAGTGRNSGKTSLTEYLIPKLHPTSVTAIKISSHFHSIANDDKILEINKNYVIVEEERNNTGKDSARMLAVGAKKVYYIQANDEGLTAAFDFVYKLTPAHHTIICESGALYKYIKPGIFVLMKNAKVNKNIHLSEYADIVGSIESIKDISSQIISFIKK